jgi:hypothetical protein
MDLVQRVFRKNHVWNIALYVSGQSFSFEDELTSPRFVLSARRLRGRGRHVHTYADPFPFVFDDALYVFYERQEVGARGSIWAHKSTDLTEFKCIGEVLSEPFHLSYPFVFADRGRVYLVPESYENAEVALYRFSEFPERPVKLRVLLKGRYVDSSFISHNGAWYLFTSCASGLEIFFTDDLETGMLSPHPMNPVVTGAFARCGGGPLSLNGALYRVAQDGSGNYGSNLSIMSIDRLSESEYAERPVVDHYFKLDQPWNSAGGHHLGLAHFGSSTVIAVDGKQNDLAINRLTALVCR